MATAIDRAIEAPEAGEVRPGRAAGGRYPAVYILLGLYCAFSILAFVWIFLVSLKTNPEFMASSPWSLPKAWLFSNYIRVWQTSRVGTFFVNSIFVAGLGTILSVGISCLAAYPLARIPFRWSRAAMQYFLVGIMVPYMLTVIPLYFMLSDVGMVGSLWTLILLYIVSGIPFNTYVMSGFFKTLPSELEEAAAMDGASPFRTFWQIMLPLAQSGIVSLLIINFVSLWNEFYYALIFLRDRSTFTVPLGLVFLDTQAQYNAKWIELFTAMLISVVPVLIIFALLQQRISKVLTVGAIKG